MQTKFSIKWGLYLGLATALATQILSWLGLGLSNWFVIATYVLVILFMALSSSRLKKLNGAKLSLLHALLHVFICILIARLIFQLYMFIYTQYIDPQWVNTVIESWVQTMQEANQSTETIERNISQFRAAYKPLNMFTIEVLKYGLSQWILGLLVSLIFVFRKSK